MTLIDHGRDKDIPVMIMDIQGWWLAAGSAAAAAAAQRPKLETSWLNHELDHQLEHLEGWDVLYNNIFLHIANISLHNSNLFLYSLQFDVM